ncbi:FG-GAP repeat domain-containing protein [Streptomyces sp. NPDC058297]|uniref:FG-GAP repeat domain-containing protein n=1 Tax=Streptomyces sp. NPDC058297 TaxID=3346433 RepID=UPI0036E31C99
MGFTGFLRRRRARTAIVTAAVLAAAGTALPFVGTAAAGAADEAVFAPYGRTIVSERMYTAGRTGFLHAATGSADYAWTDYATGHSTPFDRPEDLVRLFNTHADTVAYTTSTAGEVVLVDPVDGARRTLRVPAGLTLQAVVGETAVAYADGQCHLVRLGADGEVSDRTVTGLPDGANCSGPGGAVAPETGDGSSVVVRYTTATEGRFGLVDLETARMTALPTPPNIVPQRLQVTPQAVSWYDFAAKKTYVAPRDGSGGQWSVPNDPTTLAQGLVGSRLLWAKDGGGPVTAASADGTSSQVLDYGYTGGAQMVPGPDGSLLVFGRKDAGGDYGVHRFTETSEGTLRDDVVLPAPWYPSRTDGLALSQGRLATVDAYAGGQSSFHERKLALTGVPDAVTKENLGTAGACGAAGCPALHPTGDGRVLYASADGVLHLVDKSKQVPGTQIATGQSQLSVLGVSGRYVAYRTATATEVRDLDSGAVVRTVTGTGAAALWGRTLWQAAGSGKVTGTDVTTGTVGRTLALGTDCTMGSVQATARHVYWECATAADGAGVVNLADGAVRRLPGTRSGLLGDGFVAYVDAGHQVTVVDVTTATPTSHTVGAAGGITAGRDWTVDPSGDRVAYVDTDGNLHVVPTGIASAALAQTDSSVPASAKVFLEANYWKPRWWLSKPVSSWTLVLKNKVTGKTARTLTGGEARGMLTAAWDGWTGVTDVSAPDATYTWTLTAQPADGQGAALTKTGSVAISGARAAQHDMVGRDGTGDLLTMNSSGAFTYQHGTGKGTFSGKTSASGWSTATVAVPFGDLNGDDWNETLVRTTGGELRAYRTSGSALTPSAPYTKLGTGWSAYNTLTSPGDLTGDGRPDLLGRKASTGDIYVFAGTSTGTLAPGTKIRSAWTTYTHIVGVGDLNGDGIGDVLARRNDGTLYRYDGAGDGTLKDRVTVFTGWGATYQTVVGVGDITGDGKPDLVERDTSGNLYRNDGKGNGSFTGRTKIATGWQVYKGVF